MSDISIIGAAEGNLKNISLDIPRNKLVVFTAFPVPVNPRFSSMFSTMNARGSIWKPWPFRAFISRRWNACGAHPRQ